MSTTMATTELLERAQRERLVSLVLDDDRSQASVCEEYEVSPSNLSRWVNAERERRAAEQPAPPAAHGDSEAPDSAPGAEVAALVATEQPSNGQAPPAPVAPEPASPEPPPTSAPPATVSKAKQVNVVRHYLDVLARTRKHTGRRTPGHMRRRLDAVLADLASQPDIYRRVILIQERIDLQRDLANLVSADDLANAEAEFVGVAAAWAARKGIGREALVAVGVPAKTLDKAGISS
jgi:transposase-like protein